MTNFNSDELQLIQNKLWFERKASAASKTVAYLEEIDIQFKSEAEIPVLFKEVASKITRGENLNGFPYFVLDLPKLAQEDDLFSFRIIVWWGNYITVNLLMGSNIYKNYKSKIKENLAQLKASNFFIGIAKNHWQHDLESDVNYIPASTINEEILDNLNILKITSKHELTDLNNKHEIFHTLKLLNKLLE